MCHDFLALYVTKVSDLDFVEALHGEFLDFVTRLTGVVPSSDLVIDF